MVPLSNFINCLNQCHTPLLSQCYSFYFSEGFILLSQVEREWRQKEREEALKKIKKEEELNMARRKQIEDQKKAYESEVQREKEETEKISKLNIEHIEKIKEIDNKNKMVTFYTKHVSNYRTVIHRQVKRSNFTKFNLTLEGYPKKFKNSKIRKTNFAHKLKNF